MVAERRPTSSSLARIPIIIAAIIMFSTHPSMSSVGDRLHYYNKCFSLCRQTNCSTNADIRTFNARQSRYLLWMGWNCPEECRYQCQWRTVTHLMRIGKPLPQFYGKWTFIRWYGMEEPASVIFSVINLLVNVYAYNRYRQSIKTDQYFFHWTFQAVLTVNAWFWSALFHIRQSSVTEKFDYFSAYSLVIYSLFTITVRFLDYLRMSSTKLTIHIGIGMPFLAFYIYHIHHLFFIHFDYGYNMKVNIITGVLSSLGWLLWCAIARHEGRPVAKCLVSLFLVNSLLLLEVYDFPPVGFILDAHSLWHFGTIPIPLLWFSYLSDEAKADALESGSSETICDKKLTKTVIK